MSTFNTKGIATDENGEEITFTNVKNEAFEKVKDGVARLGNNPLAEEIKDFFRELPGFDDEAILAHHMLDGEPIPGTSIEEKREFLYHEYLLPAVGRMERKLS